MSEAWEYKLISWTSSRAPERSLLPLGRPYGTEEWFLIREAGKEPESRSADSDYLEGGERGILDLLEEFGGEGWELVSETVLDTTIESDRAGWDQVGVPVRIRWILRRGKPAR